MVTPGRHGTASLQLLWRIWWALRRGGREAQLEKGEVFGIQDGAPDPCGDPSVLGRTGAEPGTTEAAGRRLSGLPAERRVLRSCRREAEDVAGESAVRGAGSGAAFVRHREGIAVTLAASLSSTPACGHPPGEEAPWGLERGAWGGSR